jgi:hypothetical protein
MGPSAGVTTTWFAHQCGVARGYPYQVQCAWCLWDSWKIVARSSPERGGELHRIKSKVGGGAARPGSAAARASLGNSFTEVHWGIVGTYGSL